VNRPRALSIAGSDPSGGAGIQADLVTMAAFRVFGCSAVTSITVQNSLGVRRRFDLPAELVTDQIDAVMEDLGAGAVKTGMLPGSGIVAAIADAVDRHGIVNLVVDPVLRSSSGTLLVADDVLPAIRELLLQRSALVTPNLAEAAALTGRDVGTVEEMEEAARTLRDLGARCVLVKGGHLDGPPVDVFHDGDRVRRLAGERIPGDARRGTGCSLSAAIAAGLALGWTLATSVERARRYLREAIRSSVPLGGGSEFLDYFVGVDRDGEGDQS